MARVRLRAALALTVAAACAGPPTPLAVEGAFGFAPLSPSEAALYFTVVNPGPVDTLTAAEAPIAAGAMVHRAVTEDGVTRMDHLAALEVPAGGRVELRPGGLHLMLVELVRQPAPGDTLDLVLRFARAGERRVRVPLLAYGDAPGY